MYADTVFFTFLIIFFRQALFFLFKVVLVQGLLARLDYFKKRRVASDQNPFSTSALIKNILLSLLVASGLAALSKQLYYSSSSSVAAAGFLQSPGVFLLSVLIYCLLFDLWFYVVHRLLHRDFFFRHIHGVHHQLRETNILGVAYFHWAEIALYGVCHLMLAALLPMHLHAIIVAVLLIDLQNSLAHWGYEIFPEKWQRRLKYVMHSSDHALHHRQSKNNYGYFSKIWDIIFKTSQDSAGRA